MSYQKDRDEFLHIVQTEGMDYRTAVKLLRYAATLHRLAVAQCNEPWTDAHETKVEQTRALVGRSLPVDFGAVHNRDPRGAVLKLKVPSGRTNDWGQEGICVPVRNR